LLGFQFIVYFKMLENISGQFAFLCTFVKYCQRILWLTKADT